MCWIWPELQASWSISICIGPPESASGEEVEAIDKKEEVKIDNLGERGEECETVGDSNDKLANGVEGEGSAWGSGSWAVGKDESLPVKMRGELGGGIDKTVVGSRLAGIGGGGMSFAPVEEARQLRQTFKLLVYDMRT